MFFVRHKLKPYSIVFVLGMFHFAVVNADDSSLVPVHVAMGFDGNPMWVAVIASDGADDSLEWSVKDTSEFDIEVSDTSSSLTLVVLKKDAVPITIPLTPNFISEGITLEFSEGQSVSGSVVSMKDGTPVTEGLVTVHFDQTLAIPVPEESSVFAWEIEEGSTFEIRGLPAGEHIVTVHAPGYMPAQQHVVVELEEEIQELDFHLTKAVHIQGRLVDWRYRTTVEGSFETVVSPPESQTADIQADFDDEGNFQLGPFAEDAVVELVAHTASELRSRPQEVLVPADDELIFVYQWISVLGTVQDQDTGEPIPEFSFITGRMYEDETKIIDQHGQFNEEICEDEQNIIVSLQSQGYSYWASEVISFERADNDELDLGIIELEPVYEVRGRVLDSQTGAPIAGAEIWRDDSRALDRGHRAITILVWNRLNVTTTTDAAGEFRLNGIPKTDSGISAGAPGYVSEVQTIEDVTLPLEFELEPTGSISGQVVLLTGEPVAAMIHFNGGGRRTEDGNFLFRVSPGTHRYKAFADSGTSKVVEVTVDSGQSVEGIRLVIEVVGRVYGTIEGLLDGETVTVWVDGIPGAYEYVNSNGEFEISGVPEGHHVVKSKTRFGRELDGKVVIGDTSEGRIDLSFAGGSTLSGRLVSGSDGLADYKLLAQPENQDLPVVQTTSKRDGSYRFKGLVDGNYHIEVPSRSFTQQVMVQGDTYSDLHLSASRLYGKVRGSGSVEGAEVRLTGGQEDQEVSLWTKVGASGSYRFDGVPLGTYTVRIKHSEYVEVSQQIAVDQTRVELDLHLDEATHEFED